MLRPLHRAYLLIAFAILPIGNASIVAPEEVGTSAVPFTPRRHRASRGRPLQNQRPQDQAGAQRARWPARNFPAPNGGLLVFTIMADGNPACASYDGSGCLWGLRLRPNRFPASQTPRLRSRAPC